MGRELNITEETISAASFWPFHCFYRSPWVSNFLFICQSKRVCVQWIRESTRNTLRRRTALYYPSIYQSVCLSESPPRQDFYNPFIPDGKTRILRFFPLLFVVTYFLTLLWCARRKRETRGAWGSDFCESKMVDFSRPGPKAARLECKNDVKKD